MSGLSVPNKGVGIGQTYQDVTASRAGGTVYQNATGKPIQVLVTNVNNGALLVYVDSVNPPVQQIAFRTSSTDWPELSFTVPAGFYYKVEIPAGFKWVELK